MALVEETISESQIIKKECSYVDIESIWKEAQIFDIHTYNDSHINKVQHAFEEAKIEINNENFNTCIQISLCIKLLING